MPPRKIRHLGEGRATHSLRIPITYLQYLAVRSAARASGLTLAAYIRDLCAKGVGEAWPPEREGYRIEKKAKP